MSDDENEPDNGFADEPVPEDAGAGGPDVNVSGLVVDTDPSETEAVSTALASLEGLVAIEVIQPNRIAIVIEAGTVNQELGISRLINEMPGVRGVYLAYHNFENSREADGGWSSGLSKRKMDDGGPGSWG